MTDAADLTQVSLGMRVLHAVRSTVRSLGMDGFAEAQHYIRKQPWNQGVTHPAAFYVPLAETLIDATNLSDDYGHGVQVTLTQITNRDLDANLDRLLHWRELAMQAFHNKRLLGADQVYICKVEPRTILVPAAFANQYDATTFIVRALARIVR